MAAQSYNTGLFKPKSKKKPTRELVKNNQRCSLVFNVLFNFFLKIPVNN